MRLPIAVLFTVLLIQISGWSASIETGKLKTNEAVQIALKENPRLLAAKSKLDAAEANERGARLPANPDIIISPSISGAGGSDEELSVSQPLEVNGQRAVRSRIARAETDASKAAYQVDQRDVVRSVKQAYWDIARAEQIVSLNAENVKLAEALHKAAKRQVDVGSAPGSQAIKAQVELSRARQELAVAESDLAQTKASLNTILGRSPETPVVLADDLTFTPLTVDAETLKSTAKFNRPEIAEARASLAARKAEVNASRLRGRPDLALQARQEKLGGDGGFSIGITLPIIDWGSVKQDKRRAEAEVDAQEQTVHAVTNSVNLEVDSALRELSLSEKLIAEYQQGVLSQAEHLEDMAQKGYKTGATGYLEVLEAQRTLKNVRTDYYTALADHLKALAQLEWASGSDITKLEESR